MKEVYLYDRGKRMDFNLHKDCKKEFLCCSLSWRLVDLAVNVVNNCMMCCDIVCVDIEWMAMG